MWQTHTAGAMTTEIIVLDYVQNYFRKIILLQNSFSSNSHTIILSNIIWHIGKAEATYSCSSTVKIWHNLLKGLKQLTSTGKAAWLLLTTLKLPVTHSSPAYKTCARAGEAPDLQMIYVPTALFFSPSMYLFSSVLAAEKLLLMNSWPTLKVPTCLSKLVKFYN